MAVQWTAEQSRAIALDGNLLVAAAAGSGKTAVLTARIVRLIREGADVDRLLVVTFTNAAAAEMKKRIARELTRAAEEERDEAASARLREQALLSSRANISTLHAFCLHVLRRNFYDVDLDPAFRTAEAAEAAVLRQEALSELMEERYAKEGNDAFLALLRSAGGEKNLSEWVEKVYDFAMAQPEPFAWLDKTLVSYRDPEAAFRGVIAKELLASAKESIAVPLSGLVRYVDLVEAEKTREILSEEIALAKELLEETDYDRFYDRCFGVEFKRLTFSKTEDDNIKTRVKAMRDELKAAIRAQQESERSLGEEILLMQTLCPEVEELFALVRELHARYREKKSALALVDFNDMEHLTLALLANEQIAHEYRERFTHVFVDEYQDSNRVQEAIVSRIKRRNNLFLVGDVKQSIYRFRMAEPRLFMEKFDAFDGGPTGTRVDLNANFRSCREVIDFINGLFEKVMSRDLGEVDYDDTAKLYAGRELPRGQVECHLLTVDKKVAVPQNDEEAENIAEAEDAALEAMLAASRIRELMKEDPSLSYSDFAVLLRSIKTSAAAWVQTLTLCGIPAYAELTGGYFDAVEVSLMLDLLRIIDNRRQDIPLMNVLRSPFGGFDAEELAALRIRHREGSFFDCLEAASLEEGHALQEKAAAFLRKVDRWHGEASLVSVEELIGALLDETDFYHFAGALPGGPARQANLNALLSRARAFEQGGSRSLSGFLHFMEKVRMSADFGAAPTGGMDVVRILSIHKSKGLEFPVVFLAGLGKRFNLQDKSDSIALDEELGLGLRVRKEHQKTDTLFRAQIAQRQWRRQLAEEMRLLYVGTTRAQSRLILIGSEDQLAKHVEKYADVLHPAQLAKANRMLDWILYALLQTTDGNSLREFYDLPRRGGEPRAAVRLHLSCGSVEEGGMTRKDFDAWAQEAKKAEPAPLDLSWEYPHLAASVTPSKASPTSGTHRRRSELVELPAFLAPEQGMNAMGRGTAAHLLLQHIPFAAHTTASIKACIEDLCARGIMAKEQAEVISLKRIAAFFESDLGKRLCAARRTERELQFNLQLPASELDCGPSDELVMIQGVIDCCFLTDAGWVLIDYKTDRIQEGSTAEETAEKHRRQVELYARALTVLSGHPVCEMHVFLLSYGIDVPLPQRQGMA